MTDHLAEAEQNLQLAADHMTRGEPVNAHDYMVGFGECIIAHLRASQPATETTGEKPDAIPMRLPCPSCGALHIDEGDFATKLHHTHSCQECGMTWRPAVVPTVGVRFLPGFKNETPASVDSDIPPRMDCPKCGKPMVLVTPDRGLHCTECPDPQPVEGVSDEAQHIGIRAFIECGSPLKRWTQITHEEQRAWLQGAMFGHSEAWGKAEESSSAKDARIARLEEVLEKISRTTAPSLNGPWMARVAGEALTEEPTS